MYGSGCLEDFRKVNKKQQNISVFEDNHFIAIMWTNDADTCYVNHANDYEECNINWCCESELKVSWMTKNRWLFRKNKKNFSVRDLWLLAIICWVDDMAFFTLFDSILLLTLQLKRWKWWNKFYMMIWWWYI